VRLDRSAPIAVLLTAASFTLANGCAATSDSVSPVAPNATNATTPATRLATTTSTAPAPVPTVTPYWIRDKVIGAGQARPVAPEAAANLPRAALDALLSRPNEIERAEGLSTDLQTNVLVYDFAVFDGVATVNFSRTFQTFNTRPQVAQVVFTLTQFKEIKKVQFRVEGLTNGATGVPPMDRTSFEDIMPPALIDTPTIGGSPTKGKIRVSGTALLTVPAVSWRLEGADGPPLAQGTIEVKPRTGDEARGRLQADLDAPAPSLYNGPAWLTIDAGVAGEPPIRIPVTLPPPP